MSEVTSEEKRNAVLEGIKEAVIDQDKRIPARIIQIYENKNVVIYCFNGGVFRGRVEFLSNDWLHVVQNENTDWERHYALNPDHIISISLQ